MSPSRSASGTYLCRDVRMSGWAAGRGRRQPAARGSLAAGGVDRRGDLVEGAFGVGAEGADGGDADDDDQGEHDRVLDGRRAVLALQEIERELTELTHVPFSLL